jgi:hypothetical protein
MAYYSRIVLFSKFTILYMSFHTLRFAQRFDSLYQIPTIHTIIPYFSILFIQNHLTDFPFSRFGNSSELSFEALDLSLEVRPSAVFRSPSSVDRPASSADSSLEAKANAHLFEYQCARRCTTQQIRRVKMGNVLLQPSISDLQSWRVEICQQLRLRRKDTRRSIE